MQYMQSKCGGIEKMIVDKSYVASSSKTTPEFDANTVPISKILNSMATVRFLNSYHSKVTSSFYYNR